MNLRHVIYKKRCFLPCTKMWLLYLKIIGCFWYLRALIILEESCCWHVYLAGCFKLALLQWLTTKTNPLIFHLGIWCTGIKWVFIWKWWLMAGLRITDQLCVLKQALLYLNSREISCMVVLKGRKIKTW